MISRKIIEHAPEALGPYSHAVALNDTLYVSGQLGIDPRTNTLCAGIEQQTHAAMKNLIHILNESGSGMDRVGKITLYLHNMNDFQIVNGIYETYLDGNFPARVAIAVKTLPMEALIEIDAIALLHHEIPKSNLK